MGSHPRYEVLGSDPTEYQSKAKRHSAFLAARSRTIPSGTPEDGAGVGGTLSRYGDRLRPGRRQPRYDGTGGDQSLAVGVPDVSIRAAGRCDGTPHDLHCISRRDIFDPSGRRGECVAAKVVRAIRLGPSAQAGLHSRTHINSEFAVSRTFECECVTPSEKRLVASPDAKRHPQSILPARRGIEPVCEESQRKGAGVAGVLDERV